MGYNIAGDRGSVREHFLLLYEIKSVEVRVRVTLLLLGLLPARTPMRHCLLLG